MPKFTTSAIDHDPPTRFWVEESQGSIRIYARRGNLARIVGTILDDGTLILARMPKEEAQYLGFDHAPQSGTIRVISGMWQLR